VTRVIDLGDLEAKEGSGWESGNGMSLMVDQFAGWFKYQIRGIQMGRSDISQHQMEAFENRLSSNDLLKIYDQINGTSHPCSRRTLDWHDSHVDGRVLKGELSIEANYTLPKENAPALNPTPAPSLKQG
jgi:hypothetical protein